MQNIECKDCKYINWDDIEYSKFNPGYVRFGCLADNIEGKTPWIYTEDSVGNPVVCKDYIRDEDE